MKASTAAGPRHVFCPLHDTCRDVLVADEVVAGRFTIAGRTLELGTDPAWEQDPCPEDVEWRTEWVKFYFGLDLAHACDVTGDAVYRRAWERLVGGFIARVPPGSEKTEVIARRVQNWIYAWNRFDASPNGASAVDAGLVADLAGYLWDETLHVRAHLTKERNHRTLELYALLVAAMAFPDRDESDALRTFAIEELHLNLLTDVRADGVHREASTHYHCVALRSWLGAVVHARDAGISLPASYLDRLAAGCEFAVQVHRPDGHIPACSDADAESYRDVLALAASVYDRADWRFVATGGREGHAPLAAGGGFPLGGYYIQRSGWGRDPRSFAAQRHLVFDCGPLGDGGHGHYDALSVEVFGGGRPLLVDPGRYTYSEAGPNWRRWFKGTAAHNTVLVDGLDQTPYVRRRPKGPVATAVCLGRASAPGLDLVIGETRSPAYDAVHTRAVLFVAGEYWVVVDHLAASRPHAYELRWHLSPEAGEPLECDAAGVVRGNGVALAFAPVRPIRVEQGWVSPRYGVKHPAPVVVVAARAQTTSFVTLIDPRPPAASRPPMTVGFVSRGDRASERSVLDVRGVGEDGSGSDLISWSIGCDFLELGGFRGVARAAWVRRDGLDRPLAFAAADVSEGTWRLGDRVESVGAQGAGGWVSWQGSPSGVAGLRRER